MYFDVHGRQYGQQAKSIVPLVLCINALEVHSHNGWVNIFSVPEKHLALRFSSR